MKVLHIVTTRGPFFDNQIKALEMNGIKNEVISIHSGKDNGRSITNYASAYVNTLREIDDSYDIIHMNYGLTAPIGLLQTEVPTVITLWGSDLMGKTNKITNFWSKMCDQVILPSEEMVEYINCDYRLIPFGIDIDLFRPIPKKSARDILGWDPDKNIILFPYSPDRPLKNYELAKKVISNLESTVELITLGDIDYQCMPLYMNASDLVLVTSKRESGPMVVKEAALCNVPVVSTDVGFTKQVLSKISNSYVCGSEVEISKRTQDIINNKPKSGGRQQLVNEVSLSQMGEHLAKTYEDIA